MAVGRQRRARAAARATPSKCLRPPGPPWRCCARAERQDSALEPERQLLENPYSFSGCRPKRHSRAAFIVGASTLPCGAHTPLCFHVPVGYDALTSGFEGTDDI